VCILPY